MALSKDLRHADLLFTARQAFKHELGKYESDAMNVIRSTASEEAPTVYIRLPESLIVSGKIGASNAGVGANSVSAKGA